MLPVNANRFRSVVDLDGVWDFRVDRDDRGVAARWGEGFDGSVPIAVPASWNDQLPELRDFLGPAWYQTFFECPDGWDGRRIRIRFGSVNYGADVWVNGRNVGEHEGGHLPFDVDVASAVIPGTNRLVVRVDGRLSATHVPPGDLGSRGTFGAALARFPDTNFDFFPFTGIERSVALYATDNAALEAVSVQAAMDGTVRVELARPHGSDAAVRLTGHGCEVAGQLQPSDDTIELTVKDPRLWSPAEPNLYRLEIELVRDGAAFDSHALWIGIRTVSVQGDTLVLNGEPLVLRGFGRHEDFAVLGRGHNDAVMVRDFEALRWTGANCFRTSHYPYDEEQLCLADRLGIVVIDETPAVGLVFDDDSVEQRSALAIRFAEELIARDRNHPSVLMWSLANEPRPGETGGPFFAELAARARSLDPSRPITYASFGRGVEDAFAYFDIISLNRYGGWYTHPGQIEEAAEALGADLDAVHARMSKPVLLTEFGADALPGLHSEPPEMFSEEYQAELIAAYLAVLESKPYVAGHLVWNLCDFKTPQSVLRPRGTNHKGVFTRDRQPKLAAHLLRRRWAPVPNV